ncbi:MAG: DNA topoisomerase III [Culicoidibacterales bacterium]
MKTVVLAEKPSVGRDIARVLGCQQGGNGFLEGKDYIVTWALGHLVTLADPEVYDKKYQQWDLTHLPMLPEAMKLVVIRQTSKQFKSVQAQLKRNDVDKIVIATDAGREGELVARWILAKSGVKKPCQRLWISSVTDKAIRTGFANLKPAQAYDTLYAAAVARSEADWLVGMNATRALTTKYNAQLSCGRVQTPTLALIAQREQEIQQFQVQQYYGLQVNIGATKFTAVNAQGQAVRSFQRETITELQSQLANETGTITKVQTKVKRSYAPALYDLTELQRVANQRYGYSAKETLNYAQRLYEQYKLITYPRTDSRYITNDLVATLPERLETLKIGSYSSHAQKLLAQPLQNQKQYVNDAKVSDHHALLPTEQRPQLSELSTAERRIYDLIAQRFLAVLSPAMEKEETTMELCVGKQRFVAKGERLLKSGWRAIEQGTEPTEQTLVPLAEGTNIATLAWQETTGKTQPPAYFTEATLLSAMENPTQFVQEANQALKTTLKTTGGLGTVATRADIIEKLFKSFVIEKQGQALRTTSKGRQLLQLVPKDLRSPLLTAQWEQELGEIAQGTRKKQQFIGEIREYTQTLIREIKAETATFKHDNLSHASCPECGKRMLEVNGKRGKMLVCSDRECGAKKRVSQVTNARCPECHKKLSLHGQGDGQIFVCQCGYREKMSAFKKRKEQHGKQTKATRQDMKKYLQPQPAQPKSNAFSAAFAQLKTDKK